MIELLLIALICLVAVVITAWVRKYTLHYQFIDEPNYRSMHNIPTPRGGGIVIVLSYFCVLLSLYFMQEITSHELSLLTIPVFITATIALIDDRYSLPVYLRAVFYFLSAIVFVYQCDHLSSWLSMLAISILIVWSVNLYNFMDGLDGFAAIESISVLLFSMVLFYIDGANDLFWICLALLGSCFGFLYWNWHPAKIFMGDIGSCSLGLIFPMIALWAYFRYQISFYIWLILLSVFIADASFTLAYRVITGQKWWQAHKQHAYQKLALNGMKPDYIAASLLTFNIIFTWPTAIFALKFEQQAFFFVIFDYLILLCIWVIIRWPLHVNMDSNEN